MQDERRPIVVDPGKVTCEMREYPAAAKAAGCVTRNKNRLCSKGLRQDLTKFCSFDKVLIA